METKSKKQIDIRRQVLIQMSVKARGYRQEQINKANTEKELLYWSSVRINDIIAQWYREESGATTFKTFKQWKEEGFSIKKGSKAFILWAKKRKATKQDEQSQKGHEPSLDEYEFFPIAYLFSDLQVEKGGGNAN